MSYVKIFSQEYKTVIKSIKVLKILTLIYFVLIETAWIVPHIVCIKAL